LSALAHELNTPLAVTKGYALHLARSGDMPAAAQPMLDAMVRASARMERLAADLLLLSQITFGRIVLARQETDIPTLVRAVVDTMGSPLASRIRVTESGHTIASVDPERVAHAVRRLLDNAVRFSPKGSRIDVSVRSDGDDVVVSVKDRGKGIAAQERQRLFRPFSRADDGSHKDGGGLGIGLFLAREIALHHRGSLDLESVSGVGTTFRLRLPKQEAS
jgi:signal transduction histidine kinase